MSGKQKKALTFFLFTLVLLLVSVLACKVEVNMDEEEEETEEAEEAVEPTPYESEAEIVVANAPLRNGPGDDFDEIGVIEKMTRVKIIAVSSDRNWFQIEPPEDVEGIDDEDEVWISVLFAREILPTPQMMPPGGQPPPMDTPAP